MIMLYSGTPGSGKSLHVAEKIRAGLVIGKPCICNFPIAEKKIKRKKAEFIYKDNAELTPEFLMDYGLSYLAKHPRWGVRKREGAIKLFLDEAQLLFNSREYAQKGRSEWLTFFSQHRHFGYDIYLIAQFDRMLDRQIRALIEDEFMHRKVANMGKMGWIVGHLTIKPLFYCRHLWYPMKERIGGNFFIANKRNYSLYDTHYIFKKEESGQTEHGD